ncbi:MAG TPA: DUF222 domain-containing protein [Glaciibacter sp.]|nr:DUF222 domain-containing protein [Glaciibacter sp.]
MDLKPHPYDEDYFAVFGDAEPQSLRFDTAFADFADAPLNDDETPVDGLPAAYAGRLDRFLDEVSHEEASLAMQAARRARAIDQARAWAIVSDEFVLRDASLTESERENWVMRVFISEVATRLRLPEPSASRLVEDSRVLVNELSRTLDALSLARISYRHAGVIIEQARTLPESVRTAFEQTVLPDAERLPVTQFRRRAIRTRERMHPESIDDRTVAAAADRRFAFEADLDGMAWLHHLLPAAQAAAIFNRVTDIAKSLQGEGEERSLSQLRSDVAADLLIDGMPGRDEPADQLSGSSGSNDAADGATDGTATDEIGTHDSTTRAAKKKRAYGIRPTVIVTVPVLTLLGHSEDPGLLDGYGPIDADTARRLAGKAKSWMRLLTHPETGVALSFGKGRYKVPKDLRTWLEIRDETCRFPGCGRAASRSDIDHTEDWAKGGGTDAGNLACLCEPHHLMKHTTSWQVIQRGNGVLDWRSPTGHVHTTRPAIELPGTSLPTDGLVDGPPGDPPF